MPYQKKKAHPDYQLSINWGQCKLLYHIKHYLISNIKSNVSFYTSLYKKLSVTTSSWNLHLFNSTEPESPLRLNLLKQSATGYFMSFRLSEFLCSLKYCLSCLDVLPTYPKPQRQWSIKITCWNTVIMLEIWIKKMLSCINKLCPVIYLTFVIHIGNKTEYGLVTSRIHDCG